MKKLVYVLLVSMLLCGCANNSQEAKTTAVESEASATQQETDIEQKILDACTALESLDGITVSRMLEDGVGTEYSMLVKDGDKFFTCLSVDDEDNVGTIDYGSQGTINYAFATYKDSTGAYVFDGDAVYKMGGDYGDFITSKVYMLVRDMTKYGRDFREEETSSLNIMGVDTNLKAYSFKIPAIDAKQFVSPDLHARYASVDTSNNDGMKKLMDYYLSQVEKTSACSEAEVYVGVDIDGVLRYCMFTTSGLGQTLYVSNVVISKSNLMTDITVPDLTNSVDYATAFTDTANFVAQYDTIEEAMQAYQQMQALNINETTTGTVEGTSEATDETLETAEETTAAEEGTTEAVEESTKAERRID